ncbi:MAG: trypsin-like peptidase domain-containing protein [Clostridia bacterium]|nr:trypsin-like peptidase domain-containing protein [Clostridia bacterium]
MTMILKRTLATFLAICFTFIFSTSVGAISIGEDTYSDQPENYLEYDYINKTYRTIPIDSIPDYASMTTTTYELDSMAAELPRLTAINRAMESTVLPFSIVDKTKSFIHTPPTTDPYSGVVLLLTWVDINGNNIAEDNEWKRGSGFMVAPDVMVTAAHHVVKYKDGEYLDVEVRIYPYYDSDYQPSVNSTDFIYPKSWICYDYIPAIEAANGNGGLVSALNYDWCVMKLQEELPNVYNYACSVNIQSSGTSLFIVSGYSKCTSCSLSSSCNHQTYHQYSSSGTITRKTDYRVYFTNNTNGGVSGSPFYNAQTKVCYAIVNSEVGTTENGGTLINENIYNAISYLIEREY